MGIGDAFGSIIDAGMDFWRQDRAESMQDHAQNFSASQAEQQRIWQERMAGSAYQRATADMKAAGLNPMLAYHQGGATTPSGAAPSGTGASPPARSGTFATNYHAAAQVRGIDAEIGRVEADRDRIKAEEAEIRARTPTHAVNIDRMNQQIEESRTQVEKMIQETKTSAASAQELIQRTQNQREMIGQIRATVAQLQAQERLTTANIDKVMADTGLSREQAKEIAQRIRVNLPEIERAIKDLEQKARHLEMPRRGMDAAAHDSYLGALSAVLRALNPFANLSGAIR